MVHDVGVVRLSFSWHFPRFQAGWQSIPWDRKYKRKHPLYLRSFFPVFSSLPSCMNFSPLWKSFLNFFFITNLFTFFSRITWKHIRKHMYDCFTKIDYIMTIYYFMIHHRNLKRQLWRWNLFWNSLI